MPILYAVYESIRDDGLEIQSVEVKETPGGYKALERAGLAFHCRTLIPRDAYATTKREAVERYLERQQNVIESLADAIALAEENIRAARQLLRDLK